MIINCLISSLLVMMLSLSAFADNPSTASAPTDDQETKEGLAYYKDVKHNGFWWYEIKKENEEKKEEQKDKKHFIPDMANYPKEKLWTMYPEEFQVLITAFLNKAVQYPTEQNVADYYLIQNIARLRAMAFTNVATLVQQKHPELTVQSDYPSNTPGQGAKTRTQNNEMSSRLDESQNDYALIYFYRDGCEFCEAQDGILSMFVERFNWEIKKVNIEYNPFFAAKYNITTVPYLLLIYKNSTEAIPISAGVITVNEIVSKIYHGIRLLAGETTPEEYNMYEYQRNGGFDPAIYSGNR